MPYKMNREEFLELSEEVLIRFNAFTASICTFNPIYQAELQQRCAPDILVADLKTWRNKQQSLVYRDILNGTIETISEYRESFETWVAKESHDGCDEVKNALSKLKEINNLYHRYDPLEQRFDLYKLAADQGGAAAQYNLAVCYEDGNGVQKNAQEAVRYYEKAANQGYKHAQYRLGLCYQNGLGTTQDDMTALKYFELAAAQDHILAQHNLALRYEVGRGVQMDSERSNFFHVKATTVPEDQLPQELKSKWKNILINAPSLLLKIFENSSDSKSLVDHILPLSKSDLEKSHFLLHPPKAKDQRGPTCGFYALEASSDGRIHARKHDIKPTMKEKEKNKKVKSLRQIAKEHKESVTGEVYDINYLENTAKRVGLKKSAVIKSDQENYIEDILQAIRSGHNVILPVDSQGGFPGNMQGKYLHYALAWGILFKNHQYYFLVTQYGKHYLWSAEALLKSHEQMPDHIDNEEYYKDHKNDDYYLKKKDQEILERDLRKIPYARLDNYKFTGLAIPTMKKDFLMLGNFGDEEKSVYPVERNMTAILEFLFKANKKSEEKIIKCPVGKYPLTTNIRNACGFFNKNLYRKVATVAAIGIVATICANSG